MKKLGLFLIFGVNILFAQVPNKFSYQAAVRNSSGQILANSTVNFRFSLVNNNIAGAVLYQETQSVKSNIAGIVSVNVGDGIIIYGKWPTADVWGNGLKFLRIEMDVTGGSSYLDMGTVQIVSVPYANYATFALLADSAKNTIGKVSLKQISSGNATFGQTLKWNGNSWVPSEETVSSAGYGVTITSGTINTNWTTVGGDIYNNNTGNIGINTLKPTASLDLNGEIRIRGGVPANDRVLLSDSVGNGRWEDRTTKVSSFQAVGCQKLDSVTTSWRKIADIGTFQKKAIQSHLELQFQTNFYVQYFNVAAAAIFQLRVDSFNVGIGNSTLLYRSTETGSSVPGNISGIYSGLAEGKHTVSLWVRTTVGTATEPTYNPGCFNSFPTNYVLVKEYY